MLGARKEEVCVVIGKLDWWRVPELLNICDGPETWDEIPDVVLLKVT
jgi:hypothetical protein